MRLLLLPGVAARGLELGVSWASPLAEWVIRGCSGNGGRRGEGGGGGHARAATRAGRWLPVFQVAVTWHVSKTLILAVVRRLASNGAQAGMHRQCFLKNRAKTQRRRAGCISACPLEALGLRCSGCYILPAFLAATLQSHHRLGNLFARTSAKQSGRSLIPLSCSGSLELRRGKKEAGEGELAVVFEARQGP